MACELGSSKEVVDKVIEKGFANDKMSTAYEIDCECKEKFTMDTFLKECPNCNAQYAITPCNADNKDNIVKYEKGE